MSKRKRKEITVESLKLILHRKCRRATALFCSICAVSLPLSAPAAAAGLAGVNTRTIYQWVENEQLHYAEIPDGPLQRLYVCPNPLSQ